MVGFTPARLLFWRGILRRRPRRRGAVAASAEGFHDFTLVISRFTSLRSQQQA